MRIVERSLAVLTVASLYLYPCTDSTDLCQNVQHCYPNRSGLCQIDGEEASCKPQLRSAENKDGSCFVRRCAQDFMESPSYLSDPKDLLIKIQMYFYKSWMAERSAFNLTFTSAEWTNLKFRYQDLENRSSPLCRHITLANVNTPLSDILTWDCPVFDDPNERMIQLTVTSNEGKGGSYYFKTSEASKINPWDTELQDWQVFFFLHVDHVERSPFLPVTIQLAPFKNLTYNVSLGKCLDDDQHCSGWTSLTTKIFNEPREVKPYEGVQITKLLPLWSSPGTYAVIVRIISAECPDDGCVTSISPTFHIKPSRLGIWICVGFGFTLIFAFAFTVTLHHRMQQNKKLLLALKEKKPTVLLIYLPENQLCLDLVNLLAVFLKEVCYVHPYVIDNEVGSQDPNSWTSEQMNKADRLLFLVPGNPSAESITPIRDHWVYALHYLTGHYFATHQVTNKVATVLFPFSANVPYQIANVQQFELMQDFNSLVTWIHRGTWLDSMFLWGPQIKSPSQEVTTYTLPEIKKAVRDASQVTECCNDYKIERISNGKNFISNAIIGGDNSLQRVTLMESKNNAEQIFCSDVDPFDPEIVNIDTLPMLGEETTGASDYYPSSDEDSYEVDNSIFL